MKVTPNFKVLLAGIITLLLGAVSAGADSKRFAGVEITVGVMDAPAIGAPATAHAKTWEKRTGGKVRIVKFPFGELFNKFMKSLASEQPDYDVIFYAPAWTGDFFHLFVGTAGRAE